MRYFESHAYPDHPLIENKHSYVQEMRNTGIHLVRGGGMYNGIGFYR